MNCLGILEIKKAISFGKEIINYQTDFVKAVFQYSTIILFYW